jgi:hypothetical protein
MNYKQLIKHIEKLESQVLGMTLTENRLKLQQALQDYKRELMKNENNLNN